MAGHVGIQYKGTDACMDIRCECGKLGHYDGYNAYAITCAYCGNSFDVKQEVELLPFSGTWKPVKGEK